MPLRPCRSAFTLLEILIVVVTLAVLAGAVIPHFESAIEDAKLSTMLENQHELNLAVQRYKAEHGGVLPAVRRLTTRTDYSGVVNSAGKYGPYVYAIPVNPLNSSRKVVRVASLKGVDLLDYDGWVFDTSSGEIAGGLATSPVGAVDAEEIVDAEAIVDEEAIADAKATADP
ncbi:MAG: prepilin-type N-terminal cleavage/methylation domain-containing protein [Pirellulaceae bacterium]|nr:prepilin-type N-terminal cleavage/methylation domain-containing protein [Pirellulaceae bacterium]